MAEITAAMVRDLRDRTGAGMMDCKKALVATEGDLDAAVDALRKSGAAKAAKKAGRSTNEGRIVTCIGEGAAAIVEVLCETDFVAKNEKFLAYCNDAAQAALQSSSEGDVSGDVAAAMATSLTDLINNVGENIQLGRAQRWQTTGEVGSYLHMGGKIGVMAEAEGLDDEELKDLCMHICASSPQYITADEIPAELVEKEKEIAAAQPELASKPADIIGKILIGKIQKWYKDVCLMQQPWIRDDKSSLGKLKPQASVRRFARWQVGDAAE